MSDADCCTMEPGCEQHAQASTVSFSPAASAAASAPSSLDSARPVCKSTKAVPADSTTTTTTRLAIDLSRLPWARPLGIDYVNAFSKLSDFFAGDPAQPEAWRAAIARAQQHPRDRATLTAAITAQQKARNAPPAALASTARLADPKSIAIVTGQQAGLFGGPIYTLLKAITTITLARKIEQEHKVPAVPVFWIDAEDHDWEEVRGCTVLDPDLNVRTVKVGTPEGAGERPVARVALDSSVDAALEELKAALPPTELTAEVLEQLGKAYVDGAKMTHAFGAWIDALLGPLGLVVFDCADKAIKPLVAPIFAKELESPGRTAALAAEAGAKLTKRGYHAQVTPAQDSVALFYLNGGRDPIKHVPGFDAFSIGERVVPTVDLIDEATSHPEHFSPNVLLRPLVQDALFPTIAYVGGPSELAYLGQLRGIYEHFGIPMPLIYPRASATIVDAGAARFLAKYEVPLEELQPQDEAALNRLLESLLPQSVEESMEQARKTVEERMAAVIQAVPAIDPTLEGAAKSTFGKMTHELTTLHNKIIQAAKRRDDTLRRQFVRTRAQAFPDGTPQERGIGFITPLNRYGPALVDLLVQELPIDMGKHWVITL
jgi:bacillithiol biosynthesis cysteine-adding enzyme BshC